MTSAQDISDEAAAAAWVAVTGLLALSGCPVVGSMLLGAMVALLIDIPFGSITEPVYGGPVRPKSTVRMRKPPIQKSILLRR